MDLTNYTPTALSKLRDRFHEARYDPTMLTKAAIETVEEVTNGQAVLLNATGPFSMLLEMTCAQTAASVQESIANMRSVYPVLAITEDELYMHMSDEDYLNRFAVPGRASFTLAIQVQDIFRNAVFVQEENVYKLVIPRDTTITVDGVTFSLLYPIVIRRDQHGAVQFSYDSEIPNPLLNLRSTILEYTVRTSREGDQWVFLTIEALQVSVRSSEWPLTKVYLFQKTMVVPDSFVYARVFYRSSATGNDWVEIRTTHTDQVFDPNVPTAALKVTEGQLQIDIPPIYLTSGQISGDLRVDVYSTKGALSMNLENYNQENFVVEMQAIDENRDINAYTNAMAEVSYYVFSRDQVSGGTDALSFEELRNRVIYNSVGPQNLPITSNQLQAEVENNGFEIVKNIDVLTNRVFLATRKLPTPSNARLITPANIGVMTYVTQLGEIASYSNIINNGERLTIKSKALWLNTNGQLKLLSQAEIDQVYSMNLNALVNHVNSHQYFYTPFHYVLDESSQEFDVRAYSLDQPLAKDLNFVRQNQTVGLFVNTDSFQLLKKSYGYELRIRTNSGNFYKNLNDSEVGIQLAFNPKGETTYAYLNGQIESVTEDQERIYTFRIESNFDLNSDDLICITNAHVEGITDYRAWIDLETQFQVLHHTTSVTETFRPDQTDQLLGKFILPTNSIGNAHERLTLKFGAALTSLWRRGRSYINTDTYARHTTDVPLYYDQTVYDTDPVTGSIFKFNESGEIEYLVLHNVGDPVLDDQGNQVYKFRAGDVILDEQGNPVTDSIYATGREFDLLVVDGRYLFANDTASQAYRTEIDVTLTDWITDDLVDISQSLLEQTKVFFYPKTTLGDIRVLTENGGEDYLPAEQSFTLHLYVKYSVYNDKNLRDTIRATSIRLLDEAISNQTINMTKIQETLKAAYGESVEALKLSGLGGERDYQLLTVASLQNKLCLKKQLTMQADNSLIVEDAVNVEFKTFGDDS